MNRSHYIADGVSGKGPILRLVVYVHKGAAARRKWRSLCHKLGITSPRMDEHGRCLPCQDEVTLGAGDYTADNELGLALEAFDCTIPLSLEALQEIEAHQSRRGPIVDFHFPGKSRVPVSGGGQGPEVIRPTGKPTRKGKWHGANPDDYDRDPSQGVITRIVLDLLYADGAGI